MKASSIFLMFVGVLALSLSMRADAEQKTWSETKQENLVKCLKRIGVSIDLFGYEDNTSNLSLMCKSKLGNWHVLQFTDSENVELKRKSKLSGTSVGYIYKDYFTGLLDGPNDNKDHRGFMLFGGGYGDYVKIRRRTNEESSFDGLFVTLGGGSEYQLSGKFVVSWSFGIAVGGVVTDRYFTGNVIYKFFK